ncbi:hypothetical protein GRH99_07405 [Lactobacillus crispatus]|nr:hypothetical protein [Lactobacillus crispatus]
MINFTKDFTQALFDPDKINDLFRNELQQAINELLEAELTAFLGYDPYARNGWNTGNSRNGAYFRKVETQFGPIEIQVPRDRNGQFHQHTLPDYKQHSDVLESMVIKRKAKPKAEFPTEQSLDTFIGIQAINYNDRYFNRIHKGFGQVQDTLESYFD